MYFPYPKCHFCRTFPYHRCSISLPWDSPGCLGGRWGSAEEETKEFLFDSSKTTRMLGVFAGQNPNCGPCMEYFNQHSKYTWYINCTINLSLSVGKYCRTWSNLGLSNDDIVADSVSVIWAFNTRKPHINGRTLSELSGEGE